MKRIIANLLVLTTLAACDSPHPAFMGIKPQVITVQGSTFSVRIKGREAEAIRTSVEYIPRIGEIFPKAAAAIEQASGCRVIARSMKGDSAYMRARLDCAP